VEVYQLGPKACFAKPANQGLPRGDDDVAVMGRGRGYESTSSAWISKHPDAHPTVADNVGNSG